MGIWEEFARTARMTVPLSSAIKNYLMSSDMGFDFYIPIYRIASNPEIGLRASEKHSVNGVFFVCAR
jgi:hypothetical protein